ncbi:MAG: PilZ domain-containing protein [Pseudomonadales bacterium]|jgi:type IV pilus assembly protein PilZ|nr:PilZ domain-containing protein [Pseudomonadales bacterium]
MNSSTHGILTIDIREPQALHAAYMPFVDHGALFIPTTHDYELGEQVCVLLDLLDEPEHLPFSGTVVWLTPAHAQNGRAQGIGLRFNERDTPVRDKIERHLARVSTQELPTHTL